MVALQQLAIISVSYFTLSKSLKSIFRNSNISKATFDSVSNRVQSIVNNEVDGDRNSVFLDVDGSVTGIRNSSVVSNTPFFNTYRCVDRTNDWNAQVRLFSEIQKFLRIFHTFIFICK